MKIDKCICHDISFEEIYCIAQQNNVESIDELQHHVDVCNSCQMCKPYIEATIETGQTTFNEYL